ncbi:endo-1,4-beta-xylanase [Hymenobacter sp. BT188]|uniref:endo-1,4-beta-xylanase n=1 Tax=Hymenobacter sp. BT188 TaxID=2763504 RepID=UPI0016515A10|nr:endo-1,4-beta-xylanase [Hymenobacter sp. BT188]MBC6608623.1 endo-1,4-beta-xylanase [Hymenobacter sp. BT188]
MTTLRRLSFLLTAFFLNLAVYGQNAPVTLQAEAGTLRDASAPAAITFNTEGTTGFIRVVGNFVTLNGVTQSPNADNRVLSYTVTFPGAGVYDLYARVRVGAGGFDDDSYYIANSFGTRSAFETNRWTNANGLAGGGYTTISDIVSAGGPGGANNTWRWFRMSAFGGGTFTVPANNLTQTFEIGSRENGLDIDKFVFGASGVFFTVGNLDNGQQGSTTPPPPPFVPPGPPIATGKPKFVGGAFSNSQGVNFDKYWNQVVSENDGKWGSVEATRDVMNWTGLDLAYNQAKSQNVPFRMHVLVWGNQQPAWIENLPPAEQLEEIKEWFAAVAQRYPDIAFLEVVNEPTNDPPLKRSPTDQGSGNYIEALGGNGATGWDWVINSFKLAREYFPNTPLMINDYSVVNVTSNTQRYLGIINLLKQQSLIDAIGIQGHAFSTRGIPVATQVSNLNLLATTGLPLYVTEFDVDGLQDDVQLAEYQRVFPLFYEYPAVKGITLWGYRPGHWRTAQGAYIAFENGAERPALKWLREYVQSTSLSTITTATTLSAPTFCGGSTLSVPFSVAGVVAANQAFTAELSDATGSFANPTAIGSVTASAAGSYAVAATIPANTPEGTRYRIRVTSSNPSVLGNANRTNLTINPVFTAPELLVTPANNTYTGGVPTNLYLGYGPQSVTLTAAGGVSYTWSGPAGLNSTTIANPIFTASTAGVYTFVVTITNEAGCTATQQVTITVLDVRCSNNPNAAKVLVCLNGKVVCVAKNAVPALLTYSKGLVRLGDCSVGTNTDLTSVAEKLIRLFEAYPNPFSGRTTLRFRSTESGQVQLQVYNPFGQLVATPFNGRAEAGREYEISLDGSSLPEGVYTGRLLTNGKVETIRLMIAK